MSPFPARSGPTWAARNNSKLCYPHVIPPPPPPPQPLSFSWLPLLLAELVPPCGRTDAPPAPAPVGKPLPAAGAGQEPGGDQPKPGHRRPPRRGTPSRRQRPAAPAKEMDIHTERDTKIGHVVGELLEQNHYLQKPITRRCPSAG